MLSLCKQKERKKDGKQTKEGEKINKEEELYLGGKLRYEGKSSVL